MKDEVIGIVDIGSSKVASAAIDLESEGLDILAFAAAPCKGVKKGAVTDLESTSSALDSVFRSLQSTIGRDLSNFVVSVSGTHMEGATAQGFVPIYPRTRPIGSDDILQVVNHSRQVLLSPDREQVQAIPREFRIDGARGIKRPIGMNGAKLEVVTFLVSGQSSQLQNIERVIQMAGKKVTQMVLGPLASALGVLTPDEKELGSVCLDIGAGKTDMAIFSGGSIAYSACIPIGGAIVSSDIANLLRTSPEEGERLKIKFACASSKGISEDESVEVTQLGQDQPRPLQTKVLCEIVESRMKEIATFAQQHLNRSGMASMLPGGLVLTGGGSRLRGTAALFETNMRHLSVRQADPSLKFPPNAGTGDVEKASLAALSGLYYFAASLEDDEFSPVSGVESWKHRVKTLWSLMGGRS